MNFFDVASTHMKSKRLWTLIISIVLSIIIYKIFFQTVTLSPRNESELMRQLEEIKAQTELAEFKTDGCSGGISESWSTVINNHQRLVDMINPSYLELKTLPFESVCIEHDRKYHQGTSGYVGRLRADNSLRSGIIAYGIDNAEDIQARTDLSTPEQVIYLYEIIAEAVYRGVRLGGAPCTGQAYAWGYGYGGGECEISSN